MSAINVVTDHNELENAGTVSHEQLDAYVNTSPFLLASGALGSQTPAARSLAAGDGIVITDAGPGKDLTISAVPTISGSAVVTTYTHESLRQLIHFIKDGPGDGFYPEPFREVSGFPFVDRVTWWNSSSMDTRLFQTEYTRSVGIPVALEVRHKLFQADGTVAVTAIDSIAYISGVFETSRTRRFV